MKKRNYLKSILLVGALGAVMTVGGIEKMPLTALAATEATRQTGDDAHADEDKVVFTDPTLETVVTNALGTTGSVTYGDIRHYQGKTPYLDNTQISKPLPNLTSLEGLQSLQELPTGIGVSMQLNIAKGVSLAPFSGLPVSGKLSVSQDGMHNGNFTELNQIRVLEDPDYAGQREVSVLGLSAYANTTGLTDADMQQIKPLFSQFAEVQHQSYDGPLDIKVAYQRLTDFSFFKQFGKVEVMGTGQFEVFTKPVYIDPATFTPDTTVRLPAQVKGLNGEHVQTSTHVWSNDSGELTMAGTDALVKGVNAQTAWLILDHQYKNGHYPNMDPITYSDGSTLITDGMQYYPVKWEQDPDELESSSNSNHGSGDQTSTSGSSSGESVSTGSEGAQVVPKGSVVYALNPIYLYQNPTFVAKDRRVKYAKQPRVNRPMFEVTGYAKSTAGRLRYLVKDVNHDSKTAGKTGYITANDKFTMPVYYQTKQTKITVINPGGVNAASKVSLTGKTIHYRQGSVLKVVGLQKYHLTTRFKLSNGTYVTANRKLVVAGKQAQVVNLRAKTTIHRYQTANLTGKNATYAKGTRLKVQGWTYSHPDDVKTFGTLRYRVAGGYVTANAKYVKTTAKTATPLPG